MPARKYYFILSQDGKNKIIEVFQQLDPNLRIPANLAREFKNFSDDAISENTIANLISDSSSHRCTKETLLKFERDIKLILDKRHKKFSFNLIEGIDEMGKYKDYYNISNKVTSTGRTSLMPLALPAAFETRSGTAEEDIETRIIELLTECRNEGVVAIYRRSAKSNSTDLKKRLNYIIDEAEEYIYTSARTHKEMFITDNFRNDNEDRGWAMRALIQKIQSQPSLSIRVLLADCFDSKSGFRQELNAYFRPIHPRAASEIYRNGRDTVRRVVEEIDTLKDHNFRLRLLPLAPAYCMLMTEKSLVWETYLPSAKGNGCIIIEARKLFSSKLSEEEHADLHTSFLRDFIQQYVYSKLVSSTIREFLESKKDSDINEEKFNDGNVIKMAQEWENIPDTDPRISFIEEDKKKKRIQRTNILDER